MEQVKYKYNAAIEALKQIEQMSDCGSYEASIIKMKSIATDALKLIAVPIVNKQPVQEGNDDRIEIAASMACVHLGWADDGTAEPEDIKKAFKLGIEYERNKPSHQSLPKEGNDIANEYRANFLWGFPDDSIESLGYEFANGKTEAYQKECWDNLIEKIKSGDIANGRDEVYYKWVKASDKLPPLNQTIIIKNEDGSVYQDKTDYGWNKRIIDYEWLKPVQSLPIEDGLEKLLWKAWNYEPKNNYQWQKFIKTVPLEEGKDAIEFAEWAFADDINPFVWFAKTGKWVQSCGNSTSWTTEELYQLYKNNQHLTEDNNPKPNTMNKSKAAMKRAKWLAYCLEIGWSKDILPELEKTWDSYYDENGNRKEQSNESEDNYWKKQFEEAEYHISQLQEQIADMEKEIGKFQ